METRSKILTEIQRQVRTYAILPGQVARAVAARCRVAPANVDEYLAGRRVGTQADWSIGGTVLEIMGDIIWARYVEERQVKSRRRGRCLAPRHPGVPGRENTILNLRREDFLELVRLYVGLEKAGSAIIELSNDIHNRARLSSQQAALSATQGQSDLEGRITQNSPQQHEFIKDAPILAYKITSAEFKDIPEAIRQYMGATDQTTYTREYLQQNIGSVIALQMNGDKADFYIIGKSTFDQKYSVVPPGDVTAKNAKLVNKLVTVPGIQEVVSTDSHVVGALKNAPVPMIKMSEIGYDINSAVTIQSPAWASA